MGLSIDPLKLTEFNYKIYKLHNNNEHSAKHWVGEVMKLKGQRVLVTGAAGFIGSHLAEELVKEGCEVRAFVRYNSKNDWGWLETSELKKEMEIVAGDIRD